MSGRLISTETAWAILRIFLGYSWLSSGIGKLGHFNGKVLQGILGSWISGTPPRIPHNPNIWYVRFLRTTVLPNADTYAGLVVWGEIIVGALLLLGALTWVAALVGIFMNANYYFGGAHTSAAVQGINTLYIVVQILFILISAGYYFGLDSYLFGRFRRRDEPLLGNKQRR